MENFKSHYDTHFYADQMAGSSRSAYIVLSSLYGMYKPSSVIDVGCGQGTWLAEAEKLGSNELCGVDGSWVQKDKLLSKMMVFVDADLSEGFLPEKKYDLCISLEVAEHLPEARAKHFIQELCSCSDVVLFSAAIMNQGGTNHLNEQWQSYWSVFFFENGYECLDIIRPLVWDSEEVEWWYRQNILVFVRKSSGIQIMVPEKKLILDIAHPQNYLLKVNRCEQLDVRSDQLCQEVEALRQRPASGREALCFLIKVVIQRICRLFIRSNGKQI